MPRILLTAFEPYGGYSANASWLALIALTRSLTSSLDVTTRLYPVDLSEMKQRLACDLKANYDIALHVGQAPGSACIQLEEVALNVASHGGSDAIATTKVCEEGPEAYRCALPLRRLAEQLREQGIPARTSFHAGTYLCNAIFYWSCRLADELDLPTRATFVHVPLATEQVLTQDSPMAFMPSTMVADALEFLMHGAARELNAAHEA